MSYHYRKNQDSKLQQYNELTKELYSDINALEKLKLEAEFYQDKNRLIPKPVYDNKSSALADQIMNELIGNPSQPPKYTNKKPVQYIPQYFPQLKASEVQREDLKAQPDRQNHFINQRQLQKIKLQNQKHEGLFPNSSDRNKIRSFGKQQQIPQTDHQNPQINKAKSPDQPNKYNPQFNPFVKNDDEDKKRKQQKNRQYLRALEEQRLEQQRKKQMELKQEKIRKENVYHEYIPLKNQQKPLVMKKSDPNSKPPKIQPYAINNSRFDRNLIKSKAIQIKHKFNKGKIIYEQYERQINNLRKQYDGDLEELLEENNSAKINKQQTPVQVESTEIAKAEEQIKFTSNNDQEQSRNQAIEGRNLTFPIRNQSVNYSQFMPSYLNQPQSYYQNAALPASATLYSTPPPSNNLSAEYLDMMKKMFQVCIKEVKEAYQNNNTGQIYQDFMSKMITSTQNNFMPQPPNIQTSQQRQFFSDAKQHREYFEKPSNFKKNIPTSTDNIPLAQSDNSEYYDKSLSGIASKLPFNNGAVKKDANMGISLDQFYNKKYKVKKLQKFAILIDPNQSQLEIPSTSTYIRPKNAKEQRDSRCQDDLIQLRKLQTKNRVAELAEKVNKNTTYSTQRRVLKQPSNNPTQVSPSPKQPQDYKTQKSQQNPFLKKHISKQDNLMTFNEQELKKTDSSKKKYSPQSKKEILEQDEYQTQPRQQKQPNAANNFYEEYQNKINLPATKMLDFNHLNNQISTKNTQNDNSIKAVTTKPQSLPKVTSRDYFSNNQISPVKQADNQYDQSLETIKSDYESAKPSPKPLKAIDVPLESSNQSQRQRLQLQQDMIGYSQTVESIQQSNQKRPPLSKKKSVGKKKQSSLARSKLMADSVYSRSYNTNKSGSQQSPAKFDSNIYQSQYEESANYIKPMQVSPQMVKNYSRQKSQQPRIQFSPPFILEPKSNVNTYDLPTAEQPKTKISKATAQPKWKSLQQARKLAKQGRIKTLDQNKQYRSVQEKFSQLQSFLTKKEDSIIINKKEVNTQQKQKTPTKPKVNIMKLLDELEGNQEEEYRQDFQSYREESEKYL